MSRKRVYFFGGDLTEGKTEMKEQLGGKGANLAEMSNIGIPVPPGFTIDAPTCIEYFEKDEKLWENLKEEILKNLKKLENFMDKKFGNDEDPLLVSVRSGAKISMPGMMDTILNLGLNDRAVEGFAKIMNNKRLAYDSYRRFIQMYSDVAMGIDAQLFEEKIEEMKQKNNYENDTDLTVDDLKELVEQFKNIYEKELDQKFPQDPMDQLWGAIEAVFSSWNNGRAITYRNLHNIPHDLGTAVNIQTMVFGNTGKESGTGVAFTRDPSTGANKFYGEFLPNAQGEDVVAGIRTPRPLNKDEAKKGQVSLEEYMPEIYKQLRDIQKKLENHYKDMQDFEFTIQDNILYLLQTRTGKRTAKAAVKMAVDMEAEGLIDKKTAVLRIDPEKLETLLHPMIDPDADKEVISEGLPASPGAAVGKVVFDSEEAYIKSEEEGEKVVLVRLETSPEDIKGMAAAEGILTVRGGMTSHAAVVARGMGKCCVAGAGELNLDYDKQQFEVNGTIIKKGDFITLNGSSGEIMKGKVKTIEPKIKGEFETLMEWVEEYREIGVRTNADTPHDSKLARDFGAEGIGLCRTEHMFFEGDRIKAVREMILSDNEKDRRKALKKIEPMQKDDFVGIFKAMEGLPVTVRLLDPPLHEFLPHEEEQQKEIAKDLGVKKEVIKEKVDSLNEINPMLGHRGVRLGITYPEIYEMQARAILKAACEVQKEGLEVLPEIMIPLIGTVEEFNQMKEVVDGVAAEVFEKENEKVKYKVGTMIEIPRATIVADKIAETAEFFSFGTNDLTQLTFGYSRDDVGKFVNIYQKKNILKNDPFQVLDQTGVGELVKLGLNNGRKTKKNLKVGICGEHGGEPASVEFCHNIGMNYVSCSPYRVPIARLSAAQAALKNK